MGRLVGARVDAVVRSVVAEVGGRGASNRRGINERGHETTHSTCRCGDGEERRKQETGRLYKSKSSLLVARGEDGRRREDRGAERRKEENKKRSSEKGKEREKGRELRDERELFFFLFLVFLWTGQVWQGQDRVGGEAIGRAGARERKRRERRGDAWTIATSAGNG